MATVELKLKPWATPNYASIEQPARPRQDGMRELPSIPVKDLSQEALDGLVIEWLRDLYEKAGKVLPTDSQPSLSQDVIDLVIEARNVAYSDQSPDALQALDKAVEAFSERVGWDDEPIDPEDSHG